MLQRLAGWWGRQREAGALHGIIAGLVIAAIGLVFLVPWNRTPQKKALSKKAQARLTQRAEDLAPGVIQFARELRPRTRELEDDPGEHLDRYVAWVVKWSDAFSAAVEAEVAAVAGQEGVSAREVRKFLRVRLQERTGRRVPTLSSAGAIGLRSLFSVPRLRMGPPSTVQEAIEETIQELLDLLPTLPPQGQEGVKKAVLRLRKAIQSFDTKPVQIEFTSPESDVIVNFIPAISFQMSDAGSGPDPASRKLEAINTGPTLQQSTDLSGFTQVVSDDPTAGKASFMAVEVPPTAIQDGVIVLKASGTDLAGNAAFAERGFVLDRIAPQVMALSPTSGALVASPAVSLSATLQDAVSGFDAATLILKLNNQDALGSVSVVFSNPGPTGAPTQLTITGVLAGVSGQNLLSIQIADVAGNNLDVASTFDVVAGSGIILIKIDGDEQEGLARTLAEKPLRVKAVSAGSGLPIAGVPIGFEVIRNDGILAKSPEDSLGTDEFGSSEIRFVFGREAGPNVVRARILHPLDTEPVTFTLTTQVPSLEFLPLDPMNPGIFTEAPGSAVGPFRIVAKKSGGEPLPGVEIRPQILGSDGKPVADPQNIGEFFPKAGITGADGAAVFAFRIAESIEFSPDELTKLIPLRFYSQDHVQDDGRFLGVDSSAVAVSFLQPVIVSGQSQIGASGQTLKHELLTKVPVPSDPAFLDFVPPVQFRILHGGGSLSMGTGTSAIVVTQDAQGEVSELAVKVTAEGLAGVLYKKGANDDPALIQVLTGGGIPTDTFVVGPPEVRFVTFDIDGSTIVQSSWQLSDLSTIENQHKFALEIVAPVETESAEAFLHSKTAWGGAISDIRAAGQSSYVNLVTAKVEENDKYAVFRTTVQFVATDRRTLGDETVTLPENLQAVQATTFGQQDSEGSTFTLSGQDKKEIRPVRVRSSNLEVADTDPTTFKKTPRRLAIYPKKVKVGTEMVDIKLVFSLEGVDANETVVWFWGDNSQPEHRKGPDQNRDVEHDFDFTVLTEEEHQRRMQFLVSAHATKQKKTWGITVRFANDQNVGPALTDADKTAAGVRAIANADAEWTDSFLASHFDAPVCVVEFLKQPADGYSVDLAPFGIAATRRILVLPNFNTLDPQALAVTIAGFDPDFDSYGILINQQRAFLWTRKELVATLKHEREHVMIRSAMRTNAGPFQFLRALHGYITGKVAGNAGIVAAGFIEVLLEEAFTSTGDLTRPGASYKWLLDRSVLQIIAGTFNFSADRLIKNHAFRLNNNQHFDFSACKNRLAAAIVLPLDLKSTNLGLFNTVQERMRALYKSILQTLPEVAEKDEFREIERLAAPEE